MEPQILGRIVRDDIIVARVVALTPEHSNPASGIRQFMEQAFLEPDYVKVVAIFAKGVDNNGTSFDVVACVQPVVVHKSAIRMWKWSIGIVKFWVGYMPVRSWYPDCLFKL